MVKADEVYFFSVVKSLKNKKSAWDGITLDLMKLVSFIIAEPLAVLVSQSFKSNVFPTNKKFSEIRQKFVF